MRSSVNCLNKRRNKMKRIKNLDELRWQQQKFRDRGRDLQDLIYSEWKVVEGGINTRNIFQFGLNCSYNEKGEPDHPGIKNLRSVGAWLINKLLEAPWNNMKSTMKEKMQSFLKTF